MSGRFCGVVLCVIMTVAVLAASVSEGAPWRDSTNRATLKNAALEAKLQAGMLYELTDTVTGKTLLSTPPDQLPSQLLVFDTTPTDLDACQVSVQSTSRSTTAFHLLPDGKQFKLQWSIERGKGDLVLRMSTLTTKPVEQIRYNIFGCNIRDYAMVWCSAYGAGHVMKSPWNGMQLGDPQKDGMPSAYPHPLVTLFQGNDNGWVIEGRDPRTGPSAVLTRGSGDSASLGFVRLFQIPKQSPDLYELRIRTYRDKWENAVDPYVKWLETGAKCVPLSKVPKDQAWVKNISTQAYIDVGDFAALEALAKRVDPSKTLIGRQDGYRPYAMGIHYPDYHITETAKQWLKRVRELGFHVGAHFNFNAITTDFPDLVERFHPGFRVIGKDEKGKDIYESLLNGYMIRVSPALKDWRQYLIAQMKETVDAGVDLIYLDEAMGPIGNPVVDGEGSYEGLYKLMQETLDAYPGIALETEQFNVLTARHAKFALSQMPLGHPLAGYIFQKYIKVVPEGIMYSPTNSQLMDAFDYWGYMLPGANPDYEETWVPITQAYQKYGLVPDGRLPRKQITDFTSHWSSGVVPVDNQPAPPEGEKLFGLRGSKGVTAFYEKHPTKRGLVVYEPGKKPQWVGTRHFNIRSWKGQGVPFYYAFRYQVRDWLIYNHDSLLGLDPKTTYMIDETIQRSPTRFHVASVPEDFAGYYDMERRITPQEAGMDDTYFRLVFGGHGPMTIYVPDEYDAYLDGQKLDVDRNTKTAKVTVDATLPKTQSLGYFIQYGPDGSRIPNTTGEQPSMLLAFKRSDKELSGNWTDFSWMMSKDWRKWIKVKDANVISDPVGAYGITLGRLPQAKSIRLQGTFIVTDLSTGFPGDGVVLINGKPVLRAPAGEAPFQPSSFDVDLSVYAGQYVILEFLADGPVRGATAEWRNTKIVVEK